MTPYCKYNICEGICLLRNGLKIDFNHPLEAADIVADFLASSLEKDRNQVQQSNCADEEEI